MAQTYTTVLKLHKPGEHDPGWGDSLRAQADLLDEVIAKVASVALTGSVALSALLDGETTPARHATVVFTGALGAPATITLPNIQKHWIFHNKSGATLTLVASGTAQNIVLRNGKVMLVYCDGGATGLFVVAQVHPEYDIVIGSTAQVAAGLATHTWATAVAAQAAGDRVKVLNGTHTLAANANWSALGLTMHFEPSAVLDVTVTAYVITFSGNQQVILGLQLANSTTGSVVVSGNGSYVLLLAANIAHVTVSGSSRVQVTGSTGGDTLVAAEAALARNADNLSSGTVAEARIDAAIARDAEVTDAVAAEATLARNPANLSVGALANGMTGTTQAAGSNDTKLATDAYVDRAGTAPMVSAAYASPPAYTATVPGLTHVDGATFEARLAASSALSSTMNVNTLGAKPIYGLDLVQPGVGGIRAGVHRLTYTTAAAVNGGAGAWIIRPVAPDAIDMLAPKRLQSVMAEPYVNLVAYKSSAQVVIVTADNIDIEGWNTDSFSKTLNATGAAGVTFGGVNQRQQTAQQTTGWHYIWAIANITDPANPVYGTYLTIANDPPSITTFPTGYTLKRLLGAVYSIDQTFNDFYQVDKSVNIAYTTAISSFSTTTITAHSLATIVPPTTKWVDLLTDIAHTSGQILADIYANSTGTRGGFSSEVNNAGSGFSIRSSGRIYLEDRSPTPYIYAQMAGGGSGSFFTYVSKFGY